MTFIIRKVTVREFKQFDGELVVDQLQPGLNLFTGQNESGKSTLIEAIRTGFLERYKTSTLDIVPDTKPNAAPRIDVEFEVDGQAMVLSKQFLKSARCELRIGSTTLTGDEAEEKLAEALGFGRQKRDALRPEHAGIPGLLWVKQGDAHKVGESSEHAASYLRDAIAQLSGSNMSRGEDTLISAVQAELFKLVTEKRRQPTNQFLDATTALTELEAQREGLDAQRKDFESQIANLAIQQAVYDDTERKKPWDALEAKAAEAQARADAVAQLQAKLAQTEQAHAHAELELSLLVGKEKAATDTEATIAKLKIQLQQAEASFAEANSAYEQASVELLLANANHEAANKALELANSAVTASDLTSNIALHRADAHRLETSIIKAEAAIADVRSTEREIAKVEINATKLKRLKVVTEEMIPLRAEKDAAHSRVEYRLTNVISVNGAPVVGEGTLTLDTEKHIALPGLGELTLKPGNANLSEITAALEAGEAEQHNLLQILSIGTYAEGEARHEAWRLLASQLKTQKELLTLHAPNGLDDLRTRHTQASARAETAQTRLNALPDTTGAIDSAAAKRTASSTLARVEAVRIAQTAAAEKKSSGKTTTESLAETLATYGARLNDPKFVVERAACQNEMVEKRNLVNVLKDQIDAARLEVEEAKTGDPSAEAKRLRTSASLVREEQQERANSLIKLRSRLETVGASGLGERLAEVDASIEQVTRRKNELQAKADALSLLDKLLNEERAAAVRALQAPLTQRLEHYLKFVFPQAKLSLTDDLGPVSLIRGDRSNVLDVLSGGTREQIGVLTRLAYADMLRAAGRPTLLMFDDVTVNSDNARLAGLKAAILDAATRHQILVMTFEADKWQDLGVKRRAMEDLRAAA